MKIDPLRVSSTLFHVPIYGDGASLGDEMLAIPLLGDLIPGEDYLHGSWKNRNLGASVDVEEPQFVADNAPIPINRIVQQPVFDDKGLDVYKADSDSWNDFDPGDSDVRPINILNDDENNTYVYALHELEYGISEETIDTILNLVGPDKIMGKAIDLALREPSELIDRLGIRIQHGDDSFEIKVIFDTNYSACLKGVYVPIIAGLVKRDKIILIQNKDLPEGDELIISLDRGNNEIDISVDDFSDEDNRIKLLPLICEFISEGYSVVLDIDEEKPNIDDYDLISIVDQITSETNIHIKLKEELKPELNEDQPCFRLEPQRVGRHAA